MPWRAKPSQAVVATDIKEGLRAFLFFVAEGGKIKKEGHRPSFKGGFYSNGEELLV